MINPTHIDLDPQIDGAQHMEFAVGSGKNYYTSAKWQANINGMVQLPGGFEAAAEPVRTPGVPEAGLPPARPRRARRRAERAGRQHHRPDPLKNLWDLDVRLAKTMRFGSVGVHSSPARIFNALNANTELYRNPNATSTSLNRLDEICGATHRTLERRFTF